MAQKPKTPQSRRAKPRKKATAKSAQKTAVRQQSLLSLIRDLLAVLQGRNPDLAAAAPLPPGKVGPELPFTKPVFGQMMTAAATQGNQGLVVWVKNDCEIQVVTGKVTVDLGDGLIVVNIPVMCDQVSSANIQVAFAVGGVNSPAGMLVATEEQPRGPDAIVTVWSDALLAFAWKLLMTVTTHAAAAAGTDADGAGLIPVALTVNADGVRILTMARHAFDRVAS